MGEGNATTPVVSRFENIKHRYDDCYKTQIIALKK